jgi:hypothetical protein
MATFAKSTFNALIYSSFRPTYPKTLFSDIFEYHRTARHAKLDFAVDLGCGTGGFTFFHDLKVSRRAGIAMNLYPGFLVALLLCVHSPP